MDQLNVQPLTLSLTDPDSGVETAALLDGVTFVDVMYQTLYLPEAYAMFPSWWPMPRWAILPFCSSCGRCLRLIAAAVMACIIRWCAPRMAILRSL
ncbi:MAG: hypothetical protein M5U34_31525 [Chloroflexi bacterium]|nr:hypothetical protein [Chloroflexota bacterium]